MFTSRPDESARRPSADFVARFKEQHFSAHDPLQHPKQESDEMDYQNIASVRHSVYDLDPTPKAGANFRFTPSLLDPNSSAFAAFANQPPGYYTPTPGGSTYALQSYDLSGVQNDTYNTPESMSHANPQPPPSLFPSQLHPMDHQNYVHFRGHPYAQDSYQGLSISGSAAGGGISESSPSNYSPETGSGAETTDRELYLAQEVQGKYTASAASREPEIYGQFRFATTLHAATAMLRHSRDIPVTYLNKRQSYTVSVVDKSPAVQNPEVKQYRTTVRIAFDEEGQRRSAPTCWRLWKDGRGTLESGGDPDKLRAIDYEPTETRNANEKKANSSTSFQVEESSFDRFTITWSSNSETPTIYFCLRFLFLSTDFSHSKGVKGVPVRLVAKTEYLGLAADSAYQHSPASELAYCKIKLFRDKGAERKLANDRVHLERAIEKMRQQAQQLHTGTAEVSPISKKKKRNSFSAEPGVQGSPTQQRRHRRNWSFSSNTSASSGNPRSLDDEKHHMMDKTVTMEAMFSSIQPKSVFALVGEASDDPSLPISPIAPEIQWDAPGVVPAYPAPENDKLSGAVQRGSPALSQTSFSSATSEKLAYSASPLVHPLSPPDAVVRVSGMVVPNQLSHKVHLQAASKDIDAMDVDPYYIPMPAPTIRPAICVYIAPAKIGPTGDPHSMHLPSAIDPSNDLYFAVYAPARTEAALSHSIATKMGYDPNRIVRTTIINKRGLHLVLDDEVVREMLDKQDMRVAVQEIEISSDAQDEMSVDKQIPLELFLAF